MMSLTSNSNHFPSFLAPTSQEIFNWRVVIFSVFVEGLSFRNIPPSKSHVFEPGSKNTILVGPTRKLKGPCDSFLGACAQQLTS